MAAKTKPSVPPNTYTRDYYESHCDGYVEFNKSFGEIIPERLQIPLQLANICEGMYVLDVGCGRGEILNHAARKGARAFGFDYSISALEIASQAIIDSPHAKKILIHLGNTQDLPYPDHSFDRVFIIDVVEHLHPAELHQAFVEIRRVLKANGKLIVHTMPNTWYYRFGYPLYRLVQRVRGKYLPADPRDRWGYKEVHVNEQNIILLNRELKTAGFDSKVWLSSNHSYAEEPNGFVRWCMRLLVSWYPFKLIFCDDLFAIATR